MRGSRGNRRRNNATIDSPLPRAPKPTDTKPTDTNPRVFSLFTSHRALPYQPEAQSEGETQPPYAPAQPTSYRIIANSPPAPFTGLPRRAVSPVFQAWATSASPMAPSRAPKPTDTNPWAQHPITSPRPHPTSPKRRREQLQSCLGSRLTYRVVCVHCSSHFAGVQ